MTQFAVGANHLRTLQKRSVQQMNTIDDLYINNLAKAQLH